MSPKTKIAALTLCSILGLALSGNPAVLTASIAEIVQVISGDPTPLPTEVNLRESTDKGTQQFDGELNKRVGGIELRVPDLLSRDPRCGNCSAGDAGSELLVRKLTINDRVVNLP